MPQTMAVRANILVGVDIHTYAAANGIENPTRAIVQRHVQAAVERALQGLPGVSSINGAVATTGN